MRPAGISSAGKRVLILDKRTSGKVVELPGNKKAGGNFRHADFYWAASAKIQRFGYGRKIEGCSPSGCPKVQSARKIKILQGMGIRGRDRGAGMIDA